MSQPKAVGDPERLAALERLNLLDTDTEEAFERITRLAARVLDAPVALISLVDERRQFFKSCRGLPEPWASLRETPLSHSFCQHVVGSCEPLVVDDAREDPRVQDNLAIRDLGVVAYLGMPLCIADGTAIGSLCVIDREPRRWSEEQQQTLAEIAASVLTEVELRAESARHQQAVRTRDELLAAVSHDLRTPLQAIAMAAEVLDFTVAEDDKAQVEAIRRGTTQMKRLIGDLLDASAIESGTFAVERAPLSIDGLLEEIRRVFAERAAEAEVRLETGAVTGVPVLADRERIRQVLSNLLENAVKFTPAGGRIRVEAVDDAETVIVSVANTGAGIAAEDLPHLFDRFWRSRSRNRSGAGLGLSIARGIVEAHGGRIGAESRPDGEVVFAFTLPRLDASDSRS